MHSIADHVLFKSELDEQLKDLVASRNECDRDFASKLLEASRDGASARVDLEGLQGRIIRSCVLDIYDAVKRACQTSDFHTHMLFLTRNTMGQVDRHRLTPRGGQLFDGFDELRPHAQYLSDWATQPSRDGILSALEAVTVDSQHQGLVRSLTCFRDAYFQRAGNVVVQFSDDWTCDRFEIVRSENYEVGPLLASDDWHGQDKLDDALVALCKFSAAKHRARFNRGGSRTLYLMTVGSHTVPPRRRDSKSLEPSQVPFLSVIQSVWVVLSVPAASASAELLRRLAVTLPAIEDTMKSSLVLNLLHQQEVLQEQARAEIAAYDALKAQIRDAGKSYRLFQESIDRVIRVTETPSEVLRRFANVLGSTLLASKEVKYRSPAVKDAKGDRAIRDGIHAVDRVESLYNADYAADLAWYLEDAFASSYTRKRFLGSAGGLPRVEDLKWLKNYVYRLFADGEHSRCEDVKFGMLRAASRWRVGSTGELFRQSGTSCEIRDLDKRILLSAKDPNTSESWLQDTREFVVGLAAVIESWLGPWADEDESEPRTVFRELNGRCEVTLLGGKREGRPSEKDIRDMIARVKTAWQEKGPVRGDHAALCLQLARAKSTQLPDFHGPVKEQFGDGTATVLSLHWSDDQQSERWHRVSFGCADVDDKVPTRYVRLEFPTV